MGWESKAKLITSHGPATKLKWGTFIPTNLFKVFCFSLQGLFKNIHSIGFQSSNTTLKQTHTQAGPANVCMS